MSLYRVVFISLIVFSFLSCHNRQQNTALPDNGVTKNWEVEKYKMTKSDVLKGWICYNLDAEQLCCPPEWKTVNGINTYIRLNIDPVDSMTYLNVTKFEPAFHDSTYITYFRNVYNTMSSNEAEVSTDPILIRNIYNDKIVYNLRFHSIINQIRYVTFLSIFNRDGFTYGFVMKVHREKEEEYYKTFGSILYSYRVKGAFVFNVDEKLIKIQEMDISKI